MIRICKRNEIKIKDTSGKVMFPVKSQASGGSVQAPVFMELPWCVQLDEAMWKKYICLCVPSSASVSPSVKWMKMKTALLLSDFICTTV